MKKILICLFTALLLISCSPKEAEIIIPEVEDVLLDETDYFLIDQLGSQPVSYRVLPEGIEYESEYLIEDPEVVTIENDQLIPLKEGKTAVSLKVGTIEKNFRVEVVHVDKVYEPYLEKVEGATYINDILIVNKTYSYPDIPLDCRLLPIAEAAYEDMVAAAAEDGIKIFIRTGYRSYSHQASLYNSYCEKYGKEEAETFSLRPGYSEHHTGLTCDVNSLDQDFEYTPEGIWLKENCSRFGFIIRFPKEKEAITNIMFEPWHIRYLGTEIAMDIERKGLCLEEYLGVDSIYEDQR